jgi:exosortase A
VANVQKVLPMSLPESPAPDANIPAVAPTDLSAARAWRMALPSLLLLMALLLWLYRETAVAMATIWYRSETFTHGFIVLPIVLWLVWRKRYDLAALTPRVSLFMLVPIAGLSLIWLLGDLVAVNSVTQFALVAMLVATVPAVLGFAVARSIMFPLAFMFFAVPIGEFVMPQLMDWTANFTIMALRMSGIPVYREGLSFVIPSGHWSVVEACSGVRYLVASLTVGTLYAYLNYQSTQRRVLFILASILVPIVANWARAYMIVMLGHLSGNTLAVGVDHLIYGWVFFGIVILMMFFIGARWSEPEPAFGSQVLPSGSRLPLVSASRLWIVALAVAVIVSLPIVAKRSLDATVLTAAPTLEVVGEPLGAWEPADAESITFKPHFENPSAQANHVYQNGEQEVGLYLGYYRNQNYNRKLVSSNNVLVESNDKNWRQVAHGSKAVTMHGQQSTVRSAELLRLSNSAASQPERLLAWQIYWINGTLTSNDYLAKVYSAAYQLLGRGDDSAVIVVYTGKDGSDSADKTLASFLSANYGTIDAALRAARDSR